MNGVEWMAFSFTNIFNSFGFSQLKSVCVCCFSSPFSMTMMDSVLYIFLLFLLLVLCYFTVCPLTVTPFCWCLCAFVYALCVALLCMLTPSAYWSAEYTLGTLGVLEDRADRTRYTAYSTHSTAPQVLNFTRIHNTQHYYYYYYFILQFSKWKIVNVLRETWICGVAVLRPMPFALYSIRASRLPPARSSVVLVCLHIKYTLCLDASICAYASKINSDCDWEIHVAFRVI